jgi:hypothetical protein
LTAPVTGMIDETEGAASVEFRREELGVVTTREGADKFGDIGYNEPGGLTASCGKEAIEPAGLVDRRLPTGLGLVPRISAGLQLFPPGFAAVGEDRLLALPKICFAADATVQRTPPPLFPPPSPLPPFKLTTSPADVKPGGNVKSPGPPIPAA